MCKDSGSSRFSFLAFSGIEWECEVKRGKAGRPIPFCQQHDLQLVYSIDQASIFANIIDPDISPSTVSLMCDECFTPLYQCPGDAGTIEGKVRRLIERDIRNVD